MLTAAAGRRHAHAHEQFLVVGIVERFEGFPAGESLRSLMHAMELRGRAGDHLARGLVPQHERATLEEDREERPSGVAGGHAPGQPRRQIAQLPEDPGERHVAQRDLAKRLEDGVGRGIDDDGNEVAELGASRDRLECWRCRNSETTCHGERLLCLIRSTHEACRRPQCGFGP